MGPVPFEVPLPWRPARRFLRLKKVLKKDPTRGRPLQASRKPRSHSLDADAQMQLLPLHMLHYGVGGGRLRSSRESVAVHW